MSDAIKKEAISLTVKNKAKQIAKVPEKPKKWKLFSFEINGVVIERGYPHWTEIIFIIVVVGSIIVLAVMQDPNNTEMTAATKDLLGTIGGWTAVGICAITMYYNWGLFDRKRNAHSSEYLAEYVDELMAHNDKLNAAVDAQEEQLEVEMKRQKVSKATLKQLTSVVDQLGDTKSAMQMLNVGLDKFLANATKSLEKMEFEMRDFQVGMIDRGIDRLTNLLIYSFYGLDKDKSRSLEGEELNHFFSKLKEYRLINNLDDFFEVFPIGLDCYCGDAGEDLVDKIMRSKNGAKVADKEGVKEAFKNLSDGGEDDPQLRTKESKEKFFNILFDNKISKNKKDYFENIHTVDTYVINEGMQSLSEKIKDNGKNVLKQYDDLIIQLAAKEAELKETLPDENKTKIEFSNDIIAAAKRPRVASDAVGSMKK
jgi:hypothetical protein